MKIYIADIPEEGLNIDADTGTDPWWKSAVYEAFERLLSEEGRAQLDLSLTRSEGMISLLGEVRVPLRPCCDRCLESFDNNFEITIEHYLLPATKEEVDRNGKEVELDEEDIEFGTYKGKMIDLAEIVREQMVLTLPICFVCHADCRGLCSHCGANLNKAPCSCQVEGRSSPFDVLKTLKS